MAWPKGFSYGATKAGLKASGNLDMALIYLDAPGVMGAVYTKNRFPAAPVLYDKSLTPHSSIRAIIVNSGIANAATGTQGEKNNLRMAEALAATMGIQGNQVLTGSTGVIGQHLKMDLIEKALPALKASLQPDPAFFATAIMTTDLKPKLSSRDFTWQGTTYNVTGVTKGSGMIHPNMATMLAYIMTDAPLSAQAAQTMVEFATDKSFNSMSVDGDTSTNDSFHLLSSNPQNNLSAEYLAALTEVVVEVSRELARLIAEDGEGAQHLMIVEVDGATDEAEAHSVMNAILTSSLVKTAVHGCDPNWGRILMAVGNGITSAAVNPPIDICFQGIQVFKSGEPQVFERAELKEKMKAFEVVIQVNLHLGKAQAKGYGCDLSRDYIRINADYTT